MTPARAIVFWGATGQAKVLHELIHGSPWRLVALVDNRDVPSPFPGIEVLRGEAGFDAWLERQGNRARPLAGAVAVGGARGHDRLLLLERLQARSLELPLLVHKTAFVAHDSQIGEGSQILAMAAVCSHARLGRGVIVNTSASIDHDCVIGDGVHVAPGARLAGEITVGAGAFVGTGAVVLPRVTIGAHAIIGAGAVVTRDVPAGKTVVGCPAREHPSLAS